MRHFVLIITALFFIIQPLPAIQCFDDEETENEEVIILVETNEGSLPGFRGPVFIPVEAYYSNSSSGVNIVFLANIGEVVIHLTNMTTGTATQSVVDASTTGACYLPVTGGSGLYRIEFVTPDGATYYGHFNDL